MTDTQRSHHIERVFDRVPSGHPQRLTMFPITAELEDERPLRDKSWGFVLTDQGREGACVGHGVTGEAAANPFPVFGDPRRVGAELSLMLSGFAFGVYKAAQRIDEWNGESYDGTSVRAGMDVGRKLGWWGAYYWASGRDAADHVMQAVAYNGPVVMGTAWWTGMMDPDADGYLNPTGQVVGGHCWLITRVDADRQAVWTPNSWGGWGQGWISKDALRDLIANDGEAAIPSHRRR